MNFSLSTFTIEVDHSPVIAFQARWHSEADQICREWLHLNWETLATKGPGGVDLPPIYKLRLARPAERAAYETEVNGVEALGHVKIVRLIDATKPLTADPELISQTEANGGSADHKNARREE